MATKTTNSYLLSMNESATKQHQESAMSMIADAAAKAAQVIKSSQSVSFHKSLETLPSHLQSNNIFDRNNILPRQISDSVSPNGVPIKKRKGKSPIVVNASDMDDPQKQSPAPEKIASAANFSQKPRVILNGPSSLDILAASSANGAISTSILDQIPNKKNVFWGNGSITTPATPIGQVVESGQEQTGRWTREEHEAFLSALQKYGKEWKKVAAKVKTRTVVQTRTHAQKYFQKLQKAMANGNDGASNAAIDGIMLMAKDDDTNLSDGVSVGSMSKKKSISQKTPERRSNGLASLTKLMRDQEQAEATAAAAQLMAQMSSPVLIHSATKTPNSSFTLNPQTQDTTTTTPFYTFSNGQSNIKITAPSTEQINDRINKFGYSEPSPAACGKRKLAEIAAAQMLAGVAAAGNYVKDGTSNAAVAQSVSALELLKNAQVQQVNNGTHKNADDAPSLQIVNPDNLIGDILNGKKRQRWMMTNSPSTPWEDQLQVLVSQLKNKEQSFASESSSSPSSTSSNIMVSLPPLQPQPSHSAIHTAVISSDINQVSQLLILSSASLSLKPNSLGYTPLHSATCLKNNALEITRLILSVGADVMERDRDGNTALHWAVRGGNADVAHILIVRNCALDAPNHKGETPLHWGMRLGPEGAVVVRTLLADGAKPHVFNKRHRRPLDVAAQGFSCGPVKNNEAADARKNFFLNSPQSRTLILHHPECLEHTPKAENDWEVPDRIKSILKIISDEEGRFIFKREITISTEFERASLELLSRAHSADYLSFVNDLSKQLDQRKAENNSEGKEDKESEPVIPFTPMLQRTMLKDENVEIGAHSDTSFSSGSLKAARRAAGAVHHAVDCVLMARNSNAFCVVRPPGHHAGYRGLLHDSESSGFCIFNNVAAGALHALSERHRARCERVAIIDIDVHHGNGTEDIVREIDDPDRVLFFSVHLFDQESHTAKKQKKEGDKNWKFYPGTGQEDDVLRNIINVPIAPLWKEKEMIECLSSSQANAPKSYNTRNKQKQKNAAATKASKAKETDEEQHQKNHVGSEMYDENSTTDQKSNETKDEESPAVPATSAPLIDIPSQYLMGTGRRAYRNAIQHRLLPSLRAFNPDLILLSTGFDAAKDDVGNAKHMAGGKVKMGIDLEPVDYAWTTRKIMEVADICCQGRVVSVLEGGYGRVQSLSGEKSLDKSIFSQCALMHLNAMVDIYDTEGRKYDSCNQLQRQNQYGLYDMM